MRVAFDSNVLLYAELERGSPKGQLARRLVANLGGRAVVAAQVLGELLTVVRRRLPAALPEAVKQVEDYAETFDVVPTDAPLVVLAAAFAERYRLQFWDALIWQASVRGKATILLTEDMQHGFSADGMRAVNPFTMPDWPTLAADLGIVG
jgi:predicted nucleic acid-binding protein